MLGHMFQNLPKTFYQSKVLMFWTGQQVRPT
ncbi:hypothetical protein B4U79_06325 [Dinothrombium tinctorium]|uniref:Uncharacterized protein n=1 Tax=Dinothrombium tinctorium TaxID=1965070 RepID=A0A443QI93_9ACAR|nr:hypothetical protein B4U79_06325 [Dinothrombium tinctorium]